MKNQVGRRVATVVIALSMVLFIHTPAFSLNSFLQIDSQTPPNIWDGNSLTQTGMVGSVPVTLSSNRTIEPWHTVFINDHGAYSNPGYFGPMAVPGGAGDLANHHLYPGDTWRTTITLGGSLLNPRIFVGDIDFVGSSVTFPSGGTLLGGNADSNFVGDTMFSLSGFDQGTYGASGAVQYEGLFPTGHEFALDFNFDVDRTGGENISIGLASLELEDANTPPPTDDNVIPEPSTVILFTTGLLGVMARRRKRENIR